ncbi:MAG: hypothetical protein JWO74_4510 [Solirubrobacterales bacterium]|jgi:hypothetical protein|nr:hypothetical protein [Solirubrobacterales bacterium]
MGPGEHRPHDEQYWQRPWATQLFAGDLFEAVPFGDQPTHVVAEDREDGVTKHYVGEVAFGYGLLITPTCDMVDQHESGQISHPFRVLVPVVPLDHVLENVADVDRNVGLLRGRDALTAYVYLPALDGVLDGEHVACLFRPALVSDELLREPPRRVAQLQPEARRHLKIKLAAYWGRARVVAQDLPLRERGEEELRADAWPPSAYDPAEPLVPG